MRASLKAKFSIVFDPKKIIVDITTPKIPIGILILSMSPYDAEPGFPTADGLDTCPMIQDALGHPLRSNRPGADLPDVIHSTMSLVAGLRGCRFQGPRGHLDW